ncbi:MAG: hypothetical protein IJZ79_03565 [Bacilli bacterium]|nr:hypothetical protein [Bacilli bacterium]MBQ8218807.1 hypothetical protein [Bacilli bacterium]
MSKITYIDIIANKIATETKVKNQSLLQLYTLLVLTKGENITLKDVHDAWATSMNFRSASPTCYGHEHKSIVPFEQLSKETQDKDLKFVNKLQKIAKDLKFS